LLNSVGDLRRESGIAVFYRLQLCDVEMAHLKMSTDAYFRMDILYISDEDVCSFADNPVGASNQIRTNG
jgi:hypothetical protein